MTDLPPKKEREENLKWIKWSAIFSWIAVLWTIFSWWMAYNASLSSATISWRLTKENEIESRLYQQKYELYKYLSQEIYGLLNFPWASPKQGTIDRYKSNTQKLENFILTEWPKIRILAGDEVIANFNCLSNSIDRFRLSFDELLISGEFDSIANDATWHNFQKNIIWWLWVLENSMRQDLWLSWIPELHFSNDELMKMEIKDYLRFCEENKQIQTSNYFSWYLFNLK